MQGSLLKVVVTDILQKREMDLVVSIGNSVNLKKWVLEFSRWFERRGEKYNEFMIPENEADEQFQHYGCDF